MFTTPIPIYYMPLTPDDKTLMNYMRKNIIARAAIIL